ncbi:MAG: Flavobacterium phage 11b [Bacteroidota bacterium]|jgi:hypothetical protein
MVLPNKHVRKAIYDAIKNDYDCFDTNVTGNQNKTQYVIISTQNENIDKANKCNYRWESYTLLDLVTIYNGAGNVGSRVAVDDMKNDILALINNLEIDGYTVVNTRYEFPNGIETSTTTQTVFRSFIRVILTLQ